jgi:gluconate 2-dehydrogenase gamma chain
VSIQDEGRREALKILGAMGGTCAFPFSANELYGQQQTPVTPPKEVHQHPGPPERPPAVPGRVKPGYFTDAEFNVVSRVADLIIPKTDTPGALDAGVPAYIDAVVGANKELQAICRPGLAALDKECRRRYGKEFLGLSAEEQIAVLTPWSEVDAKRSRKDIGPQFFRAMKNLTADGYYTSHIGLVEELGYKGNTVMESFPESRLPEH